MLPTLAALKDAQEALGRVELVGRYNHLVGAPKKITRTIQKQFLMGFMSKDDTESLRGLYKCVIAAVETANRIQRLDSERATARKQSQ
jgi:hypothetical protein